MNNLMNKKTVKNIFSQKSKTPNKRITGRSAQKHEVSWTLKGVACKSSWQTSEGKSNTTESEYTTVFQGELSLI